MAASIIKRNGGFSSLDVIEGSRRRPLWRAVCEFFSVSSAVMYFDQVSVKRQCIVTMEDSMVGRISLSRSWKNRGISILPPPLSSSYSPPIVSMCSLITWSRHVTRNLHVTIYIYKFNISFYSIFFFVRLYFIFVADHILKNRSNLLRYLRDARFNLFERSRQIPSDLFYSRSSWTFFLEKNNQAAFSIGGREISG